MDNMNKIIETKLKEIEALCKKFHVQALEVFGSVTREDHSFDSMQNDIDFLVEFDEIGIAKYADNFFGLQDALQQLFKRPVDLVVGSSVKNPYFLESIERDREFLYAA